MHIWKKIISGCLAAGMFVLLGCGGGSTSGQSMVSGTASQGAALAAGSTVYLKDAKGVEKTTSVVGDLGSYSMVVDGLTAPFVLKAGNYYSFTTAPGTVNINPFTHLCMVNALGKTDIAVFYGDATKPPDAESLNTLVTRYKPIVDDLKTKIDTLYVSTVPESQRDFLNGTIVISQGVDKIFENIDIISNASSFIINNKGQSSILMSGVRDQATGTVTLTRDDNAIASLNSVLYPKVTAPMLTITASGDSSYIVQGTGMDGVAGIQLDINYDAASLATPMVTQGGLVVGAMLAANTSLPGSIKIAIISTRAFFGSGPIASITFASKSATAPLPSFTYSMIDSKGSQLASSTSNSAAAPAIPVASSASNPSPATAAPGTITNSGVPISQTATTTN